MMFKKVITEKNKHIRDMNKQKSCFQEKVKFIYLYILTHLFFTFNLFKVGNDKYTHEK